MKIASWNVNSLKVRLQHVLDWLQAEQPDVLGLQETKSQDENFPLEEIEALGYHVSFSGQKTYNGVALISKYPIEDVVTDLPGLDDPQRRVLIATINGVRIFNLYVPNGSSLESDKYPYKLGWLEALKNYTQEQLAQHDKLLLMGDFNIAPEDIDVHDPKAWEGGVLVSEPERAALEDLLALGLQDTFRLFEREDEQQFSWWDYRRGGFQRNHGLRIDLILANKALIKACTSSEIDRAPRELERPSDHAPVFAVFAV